MKQPHNPFILGHRIERPYFCDRHEEQKALTSGVLNGRNIVLISPRRMGKTTLAHVALQDPCIDAGERLILFLDILQTNSLGEFALLFGKAVFNALLPKGHAIVRNFLAALKSLKGTFGFDPMTGTPTFNIQIGDVQNPEYTLEEIFHFLEQSDRLITVVIDEFQQITKYPEKNTEAILRSHIQKLTQSTFVFAGSERTILEAMFVSSNRPFYNSSEIMHLGPIDKEIYVEFAREMFESRSRSLDGDAVRWIFDLLEGNTYYMQRCLNGAFAETSEDHLCNQDLIRRSLLAMLASNEVVYREMLSNITVSQKSVLVAIAAARTVIRPTSGEFVKSHALASPSAVQSALQRLVKAGFITKTTEGYRLTDPLLRIFLNQLYSIPEV